MTYNAFMPRELNVYTRRVHAVMTPERFLLAIWRSYISDMRRYHQVAPNCKVCVNADLGQGSRNNYLILQLTATH